jgi:hypothetical protein
VVWQHPAVPTPAEPLHIARGAPARVLAAAIPLAAVALVAVGSARGAMQRGADDPLPPWVIAVATIAGALVLGWRSLSQWATLDAEGIVSRNLTSTVRLPWSTVEELRCVQRPGLMIVEIHLLGTRRRQRLGPATRWAGPAADEMVGMLSAHPDAGAFVVVHGP